MTPKVSVCITTYNHESYIEKCVESVLSQKTSFDFEILIGEDKSSDATRAIVKKLEQKHPDIIRAFYHERENVFYFNGHPTGQYNNFNNLKNVRGEYVALLDGDDYWTSVNKLQNQVDYLDKNQKCFGCFHNSQLVDDANKVINEEYFKSDKTTFNQEDALKTLRSSHHTGSMMFRAKILIDMPQWFLSRIVDTSIDLLVTEYGTLDYIEGNWSAYRIHSGGVWSGKKQVVNMTDNLLRYQILYDSTSFREKFEPFLRAKIEEYNKEIAWQYFKLGEKNKGRKYYWAYLKSKRPFKVKEALIFLRSFVFKV